MYEKNLEFDNPQCLVCNETKLNQTVFTNGF